MILLCCCHASAFSPSGCTVAFVLAHVSYAADHNRRGEGGRGVVTHNREPQKPQGRGGPRSAAPHVQR